MKLLFKIKNNNSNKISNNYIYNNKISNRNSNNNKYILKIIRNIKLIKTQIIIIKQKIIIISWINKI
jgi:hypothetical protein